MKAVEQGVLHEEDSDEDRSRKYLLTIYFIFTAPTDGRQVPFEGVTFFTRWGTCALASIGFGTRGGCQMSDVGFPIVVDSHKIEY